MCTQILDYLGIFIFHEVLSTRHSRWLFNISHHQHTFTLFIFLFLLKITLSLIVAFLQRRSEAFVFNLDLHHFISILPWVVVHSVHRIISTVPPSTLGNYFCHPSLFKEDQADGQDKGDGSNEQGWDGRKLNAVTCLRGPHLECSVVRSVVPFLYPIVCGFWTCNEEWSREGMKEEDENCHGQPNLFSMLAAFWPKMEAQVIRDDIIIHTSQC